MTEELTIPGWVNSAYHGFHANRLKYLEWEEEARLEEEQERLAEERDYATTGSLPVELREREHGAPLYQFEVEAQTEQMRREDWVDRMHRGEGRPIGPALVALAAIFSFCLIVFAVVWFGAAWLDYLTPLQF